MTPETLSLPKVESIHRVRPAVRSRLWMTVIEYDNGVVLKFSGRHTTGDATAIANDYYRDLIKGGWTEDEILKSFGNRP